MLPLAPLGALRFYVWKGDHIKLIFNLEYGYCWKVKCRAKNEYYPDDISVRVYSILEDIAWVTR